MAEIDHDGLGQSLWTDLVWAWRFRQLRRREIVWAVPSDAERADWQADPELSRFGDFMFGAASVDNRRLWVLENLWNGWPDPERFAIFARERDGTLWCASNFHHWPPRWTAPEGLE